MKENLRKWAAVYEERTGSSVTVNTAPYGYTLHPYHHEWQLDIRYSPSQCSSWNPWIVVLSQVDGGLVFKNGNSQTDEDLTIDVLRAIEFLWAMERVENQIDVNAYFA